VTQSCLTTHTFPSFTHTTVMTHFLLVSCYVVYPPALVNPWGGDLPSKDVWGHPNHLCIRWGWGAAIAHQCTFLQWVSLLLAGTVSSRHISGNAFNRQERSVALFGGGMLLGGPRSILPPPASGGGQWKPTISAVDPRLRPSGHWDRYIILLPILNILAQVQSNV